MVGCQNCVWFWFGLYGKFFSFAEKLKKNQKIYKIGPLNLPECLPLCGVCSAESCTALPTTKQFAQSQSMIFSPSLNWGGVFLSVPAFLYSMSNIYISLNFKCCQEW